MECWSTSLQWLCEVAGYWQELEHAVVYVSCTCRIQSISDMLSGCIIMLQHEVMTVDERHNCEPQDLVTVSLSIQNAVNKMHLCSLSITYA